jgi:16S rRNA (guanine1207-N2)-methyltransferase
MFGARADAGYSACVSDIEKLKQDIVFEAALRGRRLTFRSTWGLFSPRRIDDGSRMLIEKAPVADGDLTLDLGCGYGAIGLALAAATPAGKVHMVDKDFVALDYARRNAEANGIANVEIYASNAFSAVPDVRFDNVAANLPANVGKELLTIILTEARDHLKPGGRLCAVTVAGLRQFIKRNFLEVFGNYAKLKQGRTYAVALAVRQ